MLRSYDLTSLKDETKCLDKAITGDLEPCLNKFFLETGNLDCLKFAMEDVVKVC